MRKPVPTSLFGCRFGRVSWHSNWGFFGWFCMTLLRMLIMMYSMSVVTMLLVHTIVIIVIVLVLVLNVLSRSLPMPQCLQTLDAGPTTLVRGYGLTRCDVG